MNIDTAYLENGEKAIFEMRSLYQKYGYSRFKMSKFEEYDLYVENKDFLVSDNVITFTDTDGRLMALKPDVTLSIVNNSEVEEGGLLKAYYNENVYRVSKGSQSYKEIMQVGLECIGNVDDYCIYEVLMLAAQSLGTISESFVLDISHLGILSGVLDSLNLSSSLRQKVEKCIGEKNIHTVSALLSAEGKDCDILKKLMSTYGGCEKIRPVLEEIKNPSNEKYIDSLLEIVSNLENAGYKGKVRVDFSLISDMNYYNGFVFKGFIEGISNGVLSGGQYDRLMEKMNKNSKAIGFAVYLDMLERLGETDREYDVDAVVLYDDRTSVETLNIGINKLVKEGKSVIALKNIPSKLKYRQLFKALERGVEEIENNA